MFLKPPRSRNQLVGQIFEEKGAGSWFLYLPDYYAYLFEEKESQLLAKSNTGLRAAKSGKGKFAFFHNLDENDIERIRRFISDYQEYVVLGLNKHIKDIFTDELDSCLALNFNADSPEKMSEDERTEAGRLLNRAKYERDNTAIPKLVDRLSDAIKRLPAITPGKQYCLTFVPPDMGRIRYLPRLLTDMLSKCCSSVDDEPIHGGLVIDKPEFKEVLCEKKVKMWQRIYDRGGVILSKPVENLSVIIIDDLYQSGSTLWSYARYLKSKGAKSVHGLVCVKTLRDTDNR